MSKKRYRSRYDKYMSSDKWRQRRQEWFERHPTSTCWACGNASTRFELHHRTYRRFEHERDGDLVALCPICHDNIHWIKKTERLQSTDYATWRYQREVRKEPMVGGVRKVRSYREFAQALRDFDAQADAAMERDRG